MDYKLFSYWKDIEYNYAGKVESSKLKTGIDVIDNDLWLKLTL